MLYRQRLPLEGFYTPNQVVYNFADIEWQYLLYDRQLTEHIETHTQIHLGGTNNTYITQIGTKRFIYPFPLENFAKFEGEAFGNIRIKPYTHIANDFAVLDQLRVTLKVLDNNSNERTLADYSFNATCQGDTTNENPPADDLIAPAFLFFFPIDVSKYDYERLILDLTIYGHVTPSGYAMFALYCEKGKKDLYLNLPVL